jgi:hypothetical protein
MSDANKEDRMACEQGNVARRSCWVDIFYRPKRPGYKALIDFFGSLLLGFPVAFNLVGVA